MKIIRDYEKYMDDDATDYRRTPKKNSFKKMKKEQLFEDDRSADRKRPEKKK